MILFHHKGQVPWDAVNSADPAQTVTTALAEVVEIEPRIFGCQSKDGIKF